MKSWPSQRESASSAWCPLAIPPRASRPELSTKRARFTTRSGDTEEHGIVEIKAKSEFDPEDYMQTLAYLKASGHKVGLLINFGRKKVEVKRLVN